MSSSQVSSSPAVDRLNSDLPPLLAAVGEERFGFTLLKFLNTICGAEHLAVFHMESDQLTGVTTSSFDGADQNPQQMSIYLKEELWRRDPTFVEAQAALGVKDCATIHTDIASLRDYKLREYIYHRRGIRDRVLLCARTEKGLLGLTLCSSDTHFSAAENMLPFQSVSQTLFALLAKHIDLSSRRSDVSVALTTLHEIESCICERMPSMPRREAEVCSRAIYGVSSLGTSLELGISQETVMTYRKRAYGRLGIATQRELFLWYLRLWSDWRRRTTRINLTH